MLRAKKKKIIKRVVRIKPKTLKKAQKKKPAKTKKILVAKKLKPFKKTKPTKKAVKQKKKIIKKIVKKIVKKKAIKPKKIVKTKKKIILKLKVKKIRAKKIAKKIVRKAVVKQKKKIPVKKVIVKKSRRPRIKKQVTRTVQTEFPAESLFKAKIKVIGIGGGGGSIVSEIGRSLEKATFVIADTDVRALKKKSGIKYFWFGEEFTHGLGTGVNVELAKRAAESAKEKIGDIFKEQDIIIFIASLGGGLGSGATQVFADLAREFGGITLGIFTMPFKFEGANKYRIAQNALRSLKQSLNVSLVIPNEKIFKVIGEDTPITSAFSTVNKSLIESLESLIDLIYNPGVINIDFADLRTILKGRGNSAFLNTIEESGKDRVEKICEKVFDNPLLQNSGFEAEKILFNIEGSENLSMFEVEKISSHISNLNPKAKIIFGISKNSKLNNKIKTTVLMTGGATQPKEEKKVEAIKIIATEPKKEEMKKEAVVGDKKEKNIPIARKVQKQKIQKKKRNVILGKKFPTDRQGEQKQSPPQESKKEQISSIPVIEVPAPAFIPSHSNLEQKRAEAIKLIAEPEELSNKKTIRRSGLEIKKAEELEEKKKLAQEKEWEIPAFLRKVKFKS